MGGPSGRLLGRAWKKSPVLQEQDPQMDDWDYPSLVVNPTLVLVGRTGNGKSATGNSILGRPAFKSKRSCSSVTGTSELQSTTLPDGRLVHVIDTPGVFDANSTIEFIGKEIAKCIDLAKEGIHAVLLVLSTRNRFTPEELAAIDSLQALFGPKIVDYMILVFTGGDELAENDEDLDTYIGDNAPDSLQKLLEKCGSRCVLFDNKTYDKDKKTQQVNKLLDIIERVIANNAGQPYSNDLFEEAKACVDKYDESEKLKDKPYEEFAKLREEMERAHAEQLKFVTNMVEEKLRAHTKQLEACLEKERLARECAERYAREAKKKSEADIRKLQEQLERANLEREDLRKKYEEHARRSPQCSIL